MVVVGIPTIITKRLFNLDKDGVYMEKLKKSPQDAYELFYENSHIHGRYTAMIHGKRCTSLNEFLREFSVAFQFPWYFGENWAAWDECATDLDWLVFQSIAVIIDDYDSFFSEEPNKEELLSELEKEFVCIEDYWEKCMSKTCVIIVCSSE